MARRRKIASHHRKMILELSGIAVKEIPKTWKEIDAMLESFRVSSPDEYRQAYDIVVNKVYPGMSSEEELASRAYAISSRLLDSGIEAEKINAVQSLSAKYLEAANEITEHAKQTAEEMINSARKEFIRYEVKVGSSKAKQIDGPLPEVFPRLLQLGAQRKNILMVGPAGSGKTYIASKLAEALNLDYMSQSCSEGISESTFTGRLLPVGKGGQFEYRTSQFVRMYENGGVFLLDEIDGSDPNVLVFLNQALAGDGFTLDIRAEKPWVKRHKDFVAIAAANTYGNGADMQYVGRNQLDAATLDRFKIGTVTMDYDETVEKAIIKSRVPEVYEWGIKIRNAIKQHGLNRIMSTRVMKDAVDMMEGQDWTLDDINKGYFADWSDAEKRMVGF